MKRKVLAIIMILCMVFALCACGDGSSNGETVTIKVAHWFAEDHPQHQAFLLFEQLVEENSDGAMQVEIYPNSQLGSEDTYVDSCKQGTVQICASGTMCAKYKQQVYAAETPFLLTNWEIAKEVFRGETVDILFDEEWQEASGLYMKEATVNGFRQFSSNIPMYSVDDFKGQRIRVPNVPNYVKMVEALGAAPIAMSLTELFTALETDAVDGQENPYPTDVTSSFYEVQDYILESNHMFSPMFWHINAKFYDGLTDEQKAILDDALDQAAEYNWQESEKYNEESKQVLLDKGVEITVPDEEFKAALVEKMQPVYDWYIQEFGGNTEKFFNAVWALEG